jgi:hypothetical protein
MSLKSKKVNKKRKQLQSQKEVQINSKSGFEDTSDVKYTDIIDILAVSPSAVDKNNVLWTDQLQDYIILLLKYGFLVLILTLNFLGLSVSLNCNADQSISIRIGSAIFATLFGFVYLLVNYYTYKVLSQGKLCKMNRDKLFPL